MTGQKQCSHCKEYKDKALFNGHPFTQDGLQSWCKACQLEAAREYQRTHREELNAAARWRRANPGVKRPSLLKRAHECCVSGECEVCACCQGYCSKK